MKSLSFAFLAAVFFASCSSAPIVSNAVVTPPSYCKAAQIQGGTRVDFRVPHKPGEVVIFRCEWVHRNHHDPNPSPIVLDVIGSDSSGVVEQSMELTDDEALNTAGPTEHVYTQICGAKCSIAAAGKAQKFAGPFADKTGHTGYQFGFKDSETFFCYSVVILKMSVAEVVKLHPECTKAARNNPEGFWYTCELLRSP